MWIMAFVILLILVILTIQYPYYNQTDSIVSFLGVQLVFILPLLAQFMNGGMAVNPLEDQILASDIIDYIRASETQQPQHPASVITNQTDEDHHENGVAGTEDDDECIGSINGGFSDGQNAGGIVNTVASTGQIYLNKMYSNPYSFGGGS